LHRELSSEDLHQKHKEMLEGAKSAKVMDINNLVKKEGP